MMLLLLAVLATEPPSSDCYDLWNGRVSIYNADGPRIFDGTHFQEFESAVELEGREQFTLSVWFNPAMDFGNNAQQPLVTQSDSCISPGGVLVMLREDGGFRVMIEDANQLRILATSVDTPVVAGQWQQVTVAFDSSCPESMELYYNGQRMAVDYNQNSYIPATVAHDKPLRIGGGRFGTCGHIYYRGEIANVNLYRVKLSAALIEDLAVSTYPNIPF